MIGSELRRMRREATETVERMAETIEGDLDLVSASKALFGYWLDVPLRPIGDDTAHAGEAAHANEPTHAEQA